MGIAACGESCGAAFSSGSSRLSSSMKCCAPVKHQPKFELGGIHRQEESIRVSQIKRYYLGGNDIKIGHLPEERILRKQKEIRKGGNRYDQEIAVKFATDLRKVVDGERENWYNDTDGCLAVIILIQFFTKCMYREDDRKHRFDIEACEMSKYILTNEVYVRLYSDYQLLTIASPLAFSESIYDNELAIEFIEKRI